MANQITINYTKEKDRINIEWKVDTKRKQKVSIESFKDIEKHCNILDSFLQQTGWRLDYRYFVYTDCDYNRLSGKQDQQELVEIIFNKKDEEQIHKVIYKVKDFSIPLFVKLIVENYNLDVTLEVNFNGFE